MTHPEDSTVAQKRGEEEGTISSPLQPTNVSGRSGKSVRSVRTDFLALEKEVDCVISKHTSRALRDWATTSGKLDRFTLPGTSCEEIAITK